MQVGMKAEYSVFSFSNRVREERADLSYSLDGVSRFKQIIVLSLGTIGFAFYLATSLFVRNGAFDIVVSNAYIGRFAKIIILFLIAFLMRDLKIKTSWLIFTAFICDSIFLVVYFLLPTILKIDLYSSSLFVNQTAIVFENIAGALLTLIFLNLLGMFRSAYYAVCIPLALAGSHAIFLLTLNIPTLVIFWLRSVLMVLALFAAIVCLFMSGALLKSVLEKGIQETSDFRKTLQREDKKTRQGDRKDYSLVLSSTVIFPFLYVLVSGSISNSSFHMFDVTAESISVIVLLLLALVVVFLHNRLGIDMIFVIIHPIFATALLFLPILWGDYTFISGIMVKCGFLLYNALLWIYLAKRSEGNKGEFFFSVGVATGVLNLFALFGRMAANGISKYYLESSDTITYISLVAIWVLAIGMLVFFLIHRKRTRENLLAVQDTQAIIKRPEHFADQCKRFAEEFGLSNRELEVLIAYARGRSASYIAKNLYISAETAKTHIKRIYAKSGLHNRQELLDHIEKL